MIICKQKDTIRGKEKEEKCVNREKEIKRGDP